jgi:hypothetical protein
MLLGSSWLDTRLVLYLLSEGCHEKFYEMLKKTCKADLKLIDQ